MANVLVEEQSMINIANELRKKLGTLLGFKPSEMADAVDDIDESLATNKKIGQIQTTLVESDFDINADDQTPGSQLLPQAFNVSGSTNYCDILKKIKSITFPITSMIAPTSMSREFYSLINVTDIDLNGLDLSNVTSVENMCYGCTNLESFDFGSSTDNAITTFYYAFYNCSKLTEVKFNNLDLSNVESFEHAFYNCKIADISFLNNKTYNNLNKIGYAFYNNTVLSDITLENITINTIGNLEAVTVFYCSNLNNVIIKNISIPNSSTIIDYRSMFVKPSTTAAGTLTFNNVNIVGKIYINGNSNSNVPFAHINMGNSILSNNNNIINFYSSGSYTNRLLTFDFSSSKINGSFYQAFKNQVNLTSVDFGSSELNIFPREIFYGCTSLATVDFGTCKLRMIPVSNTLKFDSMFYNCTALTTVDFDTADVVFSGTANNMFYGCSSLVTLDLSNVVFSNVTDTTTMFKNCTNLQSIILPASFSLVTISSSSNGLFNGCSSLQSLTLLSTTPPSFSSNSYAKYLFSSTANAYNTGMKIYVPQGCGDTYKAANGWSLFADIIYELS